MRKYLLALIVPATFAGLGIAVHAQDDIRLLPSAVAMDQTRGKVLLLKNGHAMEGDIEKVRTQYCVRRGKSEVWIAGDKAMRLCADWEDAFAYALAQIRPNDAGDRVVLARWCHLHRLRERALEQARIAVELQPGNADAKQLITMLERAQTEPAHKHAAPKPALISQPVEAAPALDVSFETQIGFATKVQPILMNKCASCHAGNAGTKFQLERVGDNSQKAASQRNLAAVLAFINLEYPTLSPLVVKAVTRHGEAVSAPLKDRQAPPAQALQAWINETIARNPHLRDVEDSKKPAGQTQPEPKSVFPTQRPKTPIQDPGVVSQPLPRFDIDERNPPRVQPTAAPRTPVDEFDAVHFNSWAHPTAYPQQSAHNRP